MSWVRAGKRAAHHAPDGWQGIRDSVYRQACAERDKAIRGAQVEGAVLQSEEHQLVADLNAAPARPAHVLRLSLGQGVLAAVMALLLGFLSYEVVSQTLAILNYGHGQRLIFTGILTVALAIAAEKFLRYLQEALPQATHQIWLVFFGLIPFLFLLGASLAVNLIGSEYDSIERALKVRQSPAVEVSGRQSANAPQPDGTLYETFYRRTGRLSSLFRLLMALGLEMAAALAFHEAVERIGGATTQLWIRRRIRRLRRQMAALGQRISDWEQEPEIRREAFTQGALLEVGSQEQARREAEQRQAQSQAEAERDLPARTTEPGPRFQMPPGLGLSLALLAFILMFAILFAAAVQEAMGAEMVVAPVDLTTSSGGEELQENLRGVEGIIAQLSLGSRLVILGITDHSFAAPALLDARLSEDGGLFGERLKAGQEQLIRIWRERSKALKAQCSATDIFGAAWRAEVLFEENPGLKPSLIFLSDMREATRKFNFEKPQGLSPGVLQRIERDRLIPSLPHVKVWILGAHAQGISEQHWIALRRFWQEYFRKAGAEVVSYSADRRWNHE